MTPEEKVAREHGYTIGVSLTRTMCWNFFDGTTRHRKNFRTEREAWEAACRHGQLVVPDQVT